MCAPEIGPSIVISTNSMAPVAMVLASRATASFPPASRSAMIPEPITQANRKKAPSPSAAIRRPSRGVGSDSGWLRILRLADIAEARLQAQLVDAFQWKRQEQSDPPLKRKESSAKRPPLRLTLF